MHLQGAFLDLPSKCRAAESHYKKIHDNVESISSSTENVSTSFVDLGKTTMQLKFYEE